MKLGPLPSLQLLRPAHTTLRPGALLDVRVLGQRGDQVQLALPDGRTLEARATGPIPPGPLTVRVQADPRGWRLQPQPPAPPRLIDALRHLLPHARTLAQLDPRAGLWQQLWPLLPQMAQLHDAAGLREAIARLGLERERRLAEGRPGPDLKQRLIELLGEAGEPSPDDLEALLNGLRSRQVELLLDPYNGWLELPYRDDRRLLRLRLDWRRPRTGAQPLVHLRLSLDLPRLGPCWADFQWDGQRLQLALWAQRRDTHRLLQRHGPRLREHLLELGFPLAALPCRHGTPPPLPERPDPPPLLDAHA